MKLTDIVSPAVDGEGIDVAQSQIPQFGLSANEGDVININRLVDDDGRDGITASHIAAVIANDDGVGSGGG